MDRAMVMAAEASEGVMVEATEVDMAEAMVVDTVVMVVGMAVMEE